MLKLSIGETVYYFDANYRVYKDDNGKEISTPNYRLHFRPLEITSEDKNYYYFNGYVDRNGISKRTGSIMGKFYGHHYVMTQEEMDGSMWLDSHRYKIIREFEQIRDINILKKVAELIGYKEGGGKE